MNRTFILALVAGTLTITLGAVWFANRPANPVRTDQIVNADDPKRDEREARDALQADPNAIRFRLQLIRALRRQSRMAEAEEELLRAIPILPEAEAQREFVLLKSATDWPPKMEGLFQKVLRQNPDDRELMGAVAASYVAKERWESAEPIYTRIVSLEPDRIEWRYQRGLTRMRTAFYATAVEDFRKVLAAEPDNDQARLFLGHSLLGDARMPEAERELQICRERRPSAIEPLVGLATCAVERNEYARAESLLNDASRLDARSPLVLQELATLLLRQQRSVESIGVLKRLLAIDPEHRQGHLQLSQAYLAVGNPAEAGRHEAIYQELDRKEELRLNTKRGMSGMR